MTKKKDNKIWWILLIGITLLLALSSRAPSDIDITVKFYDDDSNLIGQEAMLGSAMMGISLPILAVVWNPLGGDIYESDTITGLYDLAITSISFEVAVANSGDVPIDILYSLEGAEPILVENIQQGTSTALFEIGQTDIGSIPIDEEFQITFSILAEFLDESGVKQLERQKTFNWRAIKRKPFYLSDKTGMYSTVSDTEPFVTGAPLRSVPAGTMPYFYAEWEGGEAIDQEMIWYTITSPLGSSDMVTVNSLGDSRYNVIYQLPDPIGGNSIHSVNLGVHIDHTIAVHYATTDYDQGFPMPSYSLYIVSGFTPTVYGSTVRLPQSGQTLTNPIQFADGFQVRTYSEWGSLRWDYYILNGENYQTLVFWEHQIMHILDTDLIRVVEYTPPSW